MTELLSSTGAVSSSNKNETKSSTIITTGENNMMEMKRNNSNLPSVVAETFRMFSDRGYKLCVIMRSGEPLFVAKEVCAGLHIDNVSDACSRLDPDEKFVLKRQDEPDVFDTIVSSDGIKCSVDNRVQSLTLITEPGLYNLIGASKKPEAKDFKRWVNHEVLPSIRKTGTYSIEQRGIFMPNFSNPAEAARAFADLWEANENTKRALEAERQGRNEERQGFNEERQGFIAYVDVINEQKAQINNAKTATAMGTASAAMTSYRNLRSAIRQDADGQLPQVVKGFFSTNDLFNLPWFVSLFKASVTKFCNGNSDWTNEKRAIRKGLTKKLNEIVIDCLYMDMNGVKKSTVRNLFSAWKESTKTQSPMIITDDMTEYEASFRSAVGRLICVADRYQYRDKYNDLHSEPIYGYSYEVIALCLESLPESSCLKYLRDEVEIEDLKREIARVSHDGYELYQVK